MLEKYGVEALVGGRGWSEFRARLRDLHAFKPSSATANEEGVASNGSTARMIKSK